MADVPLSSARVVEQLVGRFDTERQFSAADATLKVPPSVAGQWLDRQSAIMVPISAPAIGKDVVYLEWRSGGPDGSISRQRIWAFDDTPDGVRMRFYTINKPEMLSARTLRPKSEVKLTLGDLTGYPPECAAQFGVESHSYIGRIDPRTCRIVAQSGRAMRLDVTILVDRRGFTYQEAGILDSGVRAFAVPPTVPYRFDRLSKR